MTTCILTGFAVPNRKIGASYLCDGSNIPATQDLGTRVFSGPFETAQSVPATEVTYTIIGTTPCGGQVRQTSTKTYSLRTDLNQWKYTTYISQISVGEYDGSYSGSLAWIPAGGIVSSYGQTAQQASTANNYIWWNINPNHGWSNGIDRGMKPSFIDSNSVSYIGASNIWALYSTIQLTLFYIDVHEVLTYDLI